MKAAVQQAEARFGPVGCLVNNAGVMLLGQADVQDPAEWQQMLNINVMGVLNGVHAVLAGMKARRSGTIINISSIAGRKTFPNHAAYCATKFAVHALTENIREEVADVGVRMVTIAPGGGGNRVAQPHHGREYQGRLPRLEEEMGGVIAPEVIAEAVLYAWSQPANVCVRDRAGSHPPATLMTMTAGRA